MAPKDHDLVDTGITFASGAAYGMTTVAVGQPFDTIKTVVQSSGEGTVAATRKVIAESGIIKGLWRGSLPLVLGGTFMRSAQFGCNDLARDALRDSSIPSFKIGGVVESHIVLAGMCGGLGRAVVEGPTEFFKIRQQIVAQWSYREALSGLGVTMGRNTGLFSAFVVYMDLLRPYLGDSPFVYGATCSNLAWLTVRGPRPLPSRCRWRDDGAIVTSSTPPARHRRGSPFERAGLALRRRQDAAPERAPSRGLRARAALECREGWSPLPGPATRPGPVLHRERNLYGRLQAGPRGVVALSRPRRPQQHLVCVIRYVNICRNYTGGGR